MTLDNMYNRFHDINKSLKINQDIQNKFPVKGKQSLKIIKKMVRLE